jgi:hypothetical protein
MNALHSWIAISLLAATTPAQAPTPWPLGAPVPWTQANNGAQPQQYGLCTPTVFDANQALVQWGICAAVVAFLAPGETFTSHWYQRDQNDQPVPAGVYVVGGRPFAIGAVDAGLSMHGAPHVGFARSVELAAPSQAGKPYVLAASFSAITGIALGCGATFPLDADPLFSASISGSPFFANFVGQLDQAGRTTAPAIVLPDQPWLLGIGFDLAFVTIDASQPCGVGSVSPAIRTTIV